MEPAGGSGAVGAGRVNRLELGRPPPRALRRDGAVTSGTHQRPDMDFANFEEQAEYARVFTRAMHSISFAPALAWPQLVDLSAARVLLDVAGGSGAHAIGACLQWAELRAVVLDMPSVCDVADEFIVRYEAGDRIITHRADLWDDPFPRADVHFYSNILHDWPPEKGRFLLEKSFAALAPGGRILLHEGLFDDDKSGPAVIAGYSVWMLALAEGQQYSGRELTEMLTNAGFRDIRITAACAPYSVVEGGSRDWRGFPRRHAARAQRGRVRAPVPDRDGRIARTRGLHASADRGATQADVCSAALSRKLPAPRRYLRPLLRPLAAGHRVTRTSPPTTSGSWP
jgi:hypothetical protein